MVDFVERYAKGIVGGLGTVAVATFSLGEEFCGSVWPAVASVIASILVVAVPNKPKL